MATKRVLIVSESHLIKTFVTPTLSSLKSEYNVAFDCFIISPVSIGDRLVHYRVFDEVISNEYIKGPLSKMRKIGILFSFLNLWKISRNLSQYDVIHIHYHHWYMALISKVLRTKCSKFIISFFGSDFNEVGTIHHYCNKKSIKLANIICATNPVFLDKIFDFYNLDKKIKLSCILFPLMTSFIDYKDFLSIYNSKMAKHALGFDKKIITCGYNGAKIVQHQLIWESIIKSNINNNEYKIIFPMTYGTGKLESIKNLRNLICNSELDVQIIEEYLEIEELRNLRIATDIFIHIQTKDQFSASMLEHLAAGSIVIIGNWLPYDLLKEIGIYAIWINSPNELTDALNDVITNLDAHKSKTYHNRDKILHFVNWNFIKAEWINVYNLEK